VAAVAFALVGSISAAPTKLTATVGPGYTISLKKGSARVASLKRGKYTITIKDSSREPQPRLRPQHPPRTARS
jgi:hypothetical protein